MKVLRVFMFDVVTPGKRRREGKNQAPILKARRGADPPFQKPKDSLLVCNTFFSLEWCGEPCSFFMLQ